MFSSLTRFAFGKLWRPLSIAATGNSALANNSEVSVALNVNAVPVLIAPCATGYPVCIGHVWRWTRYICVEIGLFNDKTYKTVSKKLWLLHFLTFALRKRTPCPILCAPYLCGAPSSSHKAPVLNDGPVLIRRLHVAI